MVKKLKFAYIEKGRKEVFQRCWMHHETWKSERQSTQPPAQQTEAGDAAGAIAASGAEPAAGETTPAPKARAGKAKAKAKAAAAAAASAGGGEADEEELAAGSRTAKQKAKGKAKSKAATPQSMANRTKASYQAVVNQAMTLEKLIATDAAWKWANTDSMLVELRTAKEAVESWVDQSKFASDLLTSDGKALKVKYSKRVSWTRTTPPFIRIWATWWRSCRTSARPCPTSTRSGRNDSTSRHRRFPGWMGDFPQSRRLHMCG
eukprot:TRINITY_DN85294_c0_g1_i1.p1 TRINITY_DN85294_c0_g1~~TRINITY_DN85294_c0_g1_i1.p1  ORF type:complete len:262 (+),score=65.89 TRINITY_DN85294_c0_g1_i1:26-811(+)